MAISFDVDVENEQVVLGALIADPGQRRRFATRIRPELFLDPANVAAVTALRELDRRDVPYAVDTVVQLGGSEDLTVKYLRGIERGFGRIADENLLVHIELLERDVARDAARDAFEQLYGALDGAKSPLSTAEDAASRVLLALRGGSTGSRVISGSEVRRDWETRLVEAAAGREKNFVPMHFSGLDEELYEGARSGNVTVVAARPGMGKTTLISNLVLRQTLRGRRTLALPIEPGRDAFVEQMACARARISAEKVVKDPESLTKRELFDLKRAARELLDSDRIDVNDDLLSLEELESAVSVAEYDLVTIDLWEYLMDDLDPRVVTQALRRLKKIAKRRRFHAVVVHQIKRIKRIKNPRPQLHELKNSGGYEEVADLVLLLHRAKYYNPRVERDVLEVHVAKQRRGPQNVRVGFEFHPEICRVGKHIEGFDPRDLA